MPNEDKSSEKLVDIDTSGPGADVDVAETKDQEIVDIKEEQSNEETTQNDTSADDTSEKSDVSDDVQKSEQEKTQKDSELEDYSKGVQSRISKLTRKMREAERREAAALDYARAVEYKRKEMESQFVKRDSVYNKKLEESVKTGMEAAQKELAAAIESGNAESQVEANKRIASLAFENAKLQQAKENAPEVEEPKQRPQLSDEQYLPRRTPNELPDPDPRAEDWAARNRWFGQVRAIRYTQPNTQYQLTFKTK